MTEAEEILYNAYAAFIRGEIDRDQYDEIRLSCADAMMEADRPCTDVAQQLHAVERAITAAKQQMIHDHIDHCLDHALESKARSTRQVLDEFKSISKYL